MANVFTAGEERLDLSNGGTDVFVEVLMLAVSALAESEWERRFAALLNQQDQHVMGNGVVGFDLADVDWGADPYGARDFVLRAVRLARHRHRWDELRYDPPHAEGYLRRYEAMVAAFDPLDPPPPGFLAGCTDFPAPEEAASASCLRHRVLSGLPQWHGCVFCRSGLLRS
ncbi:hypothetical protein [Streptomyces sclerotialus]|uniref:hypothetical protein n=1 Tax=Streptomyces sclerotialus TaxID=1957 RepID=UPI0004CC2E3C